MARVEPQWIGVACSVLLIIYGVIKSWSSVGTRIFVLEEWRKQIEVWKGEIDRDLRDGDERLVRHEERLDRHQARLDRHDQLFDGEKHHVR